MGVAFFVLVRQVVPVPLEDQIARPLSFVERPNCWFGSPVQVGFFRRWRRESRNAEGLESVYDQRPRARRNSCNRWLTSSPPNIIRIY